VNYAFNEHALMFIDSSVQAYAVVNISKTKTKYFHLWGIGFK